MATSPSTPPRARPLSCVQCRRKKVKCDRRDPCGPCSLRGEASSCKALVQFRAALSQGAGGGGEGSSVHREEARRSRSQEAMLEKSDDDDDGAYPSRAYLLDRLLRLEQRVQTLEAPRTPSSERGDEAVAMPQSRTINERERISLMAEDVTMGYRGGKRRRVDNHCTTAAAVDKINPMDQRTSDHVADIIYQYLALLPSQTVVRRLVAFYFDELDWFARPLDIPWFYAHLDAFFAQDGAVDVHRILPEWLACFMMTLCLATHLMDSDTLQSLHVHSPESLAESTFAGAQQILWASNFLGDCRLEHLACVILMGIYQYDKKDQADAHWTLLGSAIKAAQIMGLSDMDDAASSWHEADMDVAQRAKRVWWTLVWFDWSHAFGHRGRYAVLATQNKTSLPQNVDKGMSRAKDCNTVRTLNTFTIARSHLVTIYREATDTFYATNTSKGGSLDRSDTDSLDKRLDHVIRELPRLYTEVAFDDVPREHAYEALFVQLNIQNRILRLHRHVQNQGADAEEGVSPSQKKCLDAALAIASLLERARERYAVMTRIWIVTLYAIGAGLVLFLEQRREGWLDDRLERYLVVLIELFESNQHRSYAARNAARLLRRLRRIDRASLSHTTPERRGRSGEKVLVEAIESFHRRQPEKPNSMSAVNTRDSNLNRVTYSTQASQPHIGTDAQSILGVLDVGLGQDMDMGSSTDFGYILDMWNEAAQL